MFVKTCLYFKMVFLILASDYSEIETFHVQIFSVLVNHFGFGWAKVKSKNWVIKTLKNEKGFMLYILKQLSSQFASLQY